MEALNIRKCHFDVRKLYLNGKDGELAPAYLSVAENCRAREQNELVQLLGPDILERTFKDTF